MGAAAAAREAYLGLKHELDQFLALNGDDLNAMPEALGREMLAKAEAVNAARSRAGKLAEAEDAARQGVQPRAIYGMDGAVPFPGAGAPVAGGYSWGQSFIDSRLQSAGGRSNFQAAVLSPGSTAVSVPLRPTPITDPRRARFVYELLGEEDAPGGLFSYLKQTARDLNAAVVAPGARKPTSTFSLTRVNDSTKVIAHVTEPIDRFVIEDAPLLRQFIDDELRLGVNLALDAVVVAAILDAATAGETTLDLSGIRTAITSLQLLEMEPTAITINPTSWQAVEDEAVATFAANSNAPAATDALDRRLYGVPVTVTTGIDPGIAVVGAFRESAQLFVTGGVRIDVSDAAPQEIEGEWVSGFQTNTLMFRGERRAEVAVSRPTGFVVVGPTGS